MIHVMVKRRRREGGREGLRGEFVKVRYLGTQVGKVYIKKIGCFLISLIPIHLSIPPSHP
jgi:hypothetical protein